MSSKINTIQRKCLVPTSCIERFLPLTGAIADIAGTSGISNIRGNYQIGYLDPMPLHMVIFTKSGTGLLQTPTHNYLLEADSVIIVPAGVSCMFNNETETWQILWFYLYATPQWEHLIDDGVRHQPTELLPQIEVAMEGYLTGVQTLQKDKRVAAIFSDLMACYLEQAFCPSQEQHIDEAKLKLEKIWHKVSERPSHKWSKTEMAKSLYVSPSTFDRLVKKYYGITPWQKVIQIRMELAAMLLTKTDYSIQVIADRTGYANEFIFSTAFKKHSSLSPKFYRQKFK